MEEVSTYTFNQGLLLAARASGAPDSFQAEGKAWDDAFEPIAKLLNADPCVRTWHLNVYRDPIFGFWPAASELLLQGQFDLILGLLSPEFNKAVFRVSVSQAKKELSELPNSEWFESLGQVFAASLHRTNGSVAQLV